MNEEPEEAREEWPWSTEELEEEIRAVKERVTFWKESYIVQGILDEETLEWFGAELPLLLVFERNSDKNPEEAYPRKEKKKLIGCEEALQIIVDKLKSLANSSVIATYKMTFPRSIEKSFHLKIERGNSRIWLKLVF
jgi:hypothetical protein